jgi:hypothetical protein
MAVTARKTTLQVAERRVNKWDTPWLNTKFSIGSLIILIVLLFGLLGPLFWNTDLAYTASSPINLPPMWMKGGSPEHPLGTESNGRDMLAQLIVGIPASLKVGLLAASIGMAVGILLGSLLPSPRAAQGIGVTLYLLMLLLCGAGPPPEVLSSTLRHIADGLPLTHAIRIVQDAWLGFAAEPVSLLAAVGFLVGATVLAVRLFRWD